MSNATDIRQSGGTAGSVDHTDTSLAVSRTIPVPPTDTLYRAALTFCLDGADVMMYATLKGAENAESLWHALAQSHPSQPSEICGPALSRIDRMFVDGLTRWGRKASANAMRSFRNALACWHNRMMDLPSQDIIQLADWFTMDGTQWIIGPGHPCWPSQLADLSIRSDWARTAVFVDQRRSTRIDQLRQTGRHRRFTGRDRIWPVCGTHRSRTGSRCRASGRVRRRDGHGCGGTLGSVECAARQNARQCGQKPLPYSPAGSTISDRCVTARCSNASRRRVVRSISRAVPGTFPKPVVFCFATALSRPCLPH